MDKTEPTNVASGDWPFTAVRLSLAANGHGRTNALTDHSSIDEAIALLAEAVTMTSKCREGAVLVSTAEQRRGNRRMFTRLYTRERKPDGKGGREIVEQVAPAMLKHLETRRRRVEKMHGELIAMRVIVAKAGGASDGEIAY